MAIAVKYNTGKVEDGPGKVTVGPASIKVASDQMFIAWEDPPSDLPSAGGFSEQVTVTQDSKGIQVEFSESLVVVIDAWLHSLKGKENPELQASRWYNRATVTSALGLFLGALGLVAQLSAAYFPPWIAALIPVFAAGALFAMVSTIGLFALMVYWAGKWNERAIQ